MRRVNRSSGGCSAHENHFRCVWFVLIACGGGKAESFKRPFPACARACEIHDMMGTKTVGKTKRHSVLDCRCSTRRANSAQGQARETTQPAPQRPFTSSECSASPLPPSPPPASRTKANTLRKNSAAKNHTHARQKERERPPRLINVYFVQVLSQSTYRTACTSRLDREYARARRSACANPHLRLLATI